MMNHHCHQTDQVTSFLYPLNRCVFIPRQNGSPDFRNASNSYSMLKDNRVDVIASSNRFFFSNCHVSRVPQNWVIYR